MEIYQTENYSISPIQKYFKVFNRLHSVLGSICSARKTDLISFQSLCVVLGPIFRVQYRRMMINSIFQIVWFNMSTVFGAEAAKLKNMSEREKMISRKQKWPQNDSCTASKSSKWSHIALTQKSSYLLTFQIKCSIISLFYFMHKILH